MATCRGEELLHLEDIRLLCLAARPGRCQPALEVAQRGPLPARLCPPAAQSPRTWHDAIRDAQQSEAELDEFRPAPHRQSCAHRAQTSDRGLVVVVSAGVVAI